MWMLLKDNGVYRLTTVYDRGLVLTQDTAALCNMSLSSTAMSPSSPEVREEEETKEITLNRESMLVSIIDNI